MAFTAQRYIESQLEAIAPFPVGSPQNGVMAIKIHSSRGETNWLAITPETFKKLEIILLAQAAQEDAAEEPKQDQIETVLLAGVHQWAIQVNGLLDVSFPYQKTEELAEALAKKKYKGAKILTTKDSDHYSNR